MSKESIGLVVLERGIVYTTDRWENISRDPQPINSHSHLAKTKDKKNQKTCIYKVSLSLSVGQGKQK